MLGLAGAIFVAGWASDEGRRTGSTWSCRPDVAGPLDGPERARACSPRSVIVTARDRGARRRSPSRRRAATSSTPVVGIVDPRAGRGWRSPGIGLAVGGLVRVVTGGAGRRRRWSSPRSCSTSLGAALKLPDAVLQLVIYKHLGQPMAGVYDPVGHRRRGRPRGRRPAASARGACSGGTWTGNVRGWTP